MTNSQKTKRRAFIMTGGGAKGLYEAGVIHAFHITGMEFDVITGSSIGAMNAIFYAEYLLRKRELDAAVRADPERAVEKMDNLVKAYHHAWLEMPDKKIIDDSEGGPLGKLKNDLLRFNLNLPDITRIAWWWTDPERGKIPSPGVWTAVLSLAKELVERLGGAGELLRIFKYHRDAPFDEAIRTYLARFGMEKSLVPPEDDAKFRAVFSGPVSPLREEHLQENLAGHTGNDDEQIDLVDVGRSLRDFAEAGVDVRLTRANLRTGRLEISTYQSTEDFVRYMVRQAWRLQSTDPESLPLRSFRLQVPGNPNAINAALASGRFPGVLAPYPIERIYLSDDSENALLYTLLEKWLEDPEIESIMSEAYQALHPNEAGSDQRFQNLFNSWRESENLREFFPHAADLYVDGGAIDNTPSNSAIDATREWADREGCSKRDVVLDQYVIFLHPEPIVDSVDIQDPGFFQTVNRARELQGVSKETGDAVVVNTINTLGRRGEELGETLLILLDSHREVFSMMDEDQISAVEDRLREQARERGLRGYLGRASGGILERIAKWGQNTISSDLPLQVEEVIIYPEEMPLDTLQFTERLGYRKDNAIKMLTMGCYNTLWTLRRRLEEQEAKRDTHDEEVLTLAIKWTGIETWPDVPSEHEQLRRTWRCQRTACVFHTHHCAHGAVLSGSARNT